MGVKFLLSVMNVVLQHAKGAFQPLALFRVHSWPSTHSSVLGVPLDQLSSM